VGVLDARLLPAPLASPRDLPALSDRPLPRAVPLMAYVPTAPALRDPVVLDGLKYRIREIDADGTCRLRVSFGEERAAIKADRLVWDKVAGVWREKAA
jgi:hypothetical protein